MADNSEQPAKFSVVVLTAAPPGVAMEGVAAFVKVDGREALLRSIELFLNRPNIVQVQLVITPAELPNAKAKFGAHLSFSGVKLIAGGPKWMDQIGAAAPTLAPEATHVIVHDAARPAVPFDDIDTLCELALAHESVGLTVALNAPLVEVDSAGAAKAYRLPEHYVQLLTPQAFGRSAFDEMAKTKMELSAARATLLAGSPLNLRLSGGRDAARVGAMLKLLPKPRVKTPSSPFEEAQW